MANVDLPTPQNCPIKTSDGTKTCTIMCRKCKEVAERVCFSIRVAYRYGYEKASDKYIDDIRKTKGCIDTMMNYLTGDGDDDADSSD